MAADDDTTSTKSRWKKPHFMSPICKYLMPEVPPRARRASSASARERDAKEGEEREDGGNGDDERWGRKRREEGGVRYEEERAKGDKVESMSQRLADESAPHRTLHVKHLAPRLCRSRAVGGSEQEELRIVGSVGPPEGGVEIEAWAPDKNIEDALAGVANADPGVEAEWTGMGVAATEMPEMSACGAGVRKGEPELAHEHPAAQSEDKAAQDDDKAAHDDASASESSPPLLILSVPSLSTGSDLR
ncbi:hypothetical protein C8F04DRAFT_1195245 [Mycena alexandri]|uniref:Uncharacterized protein n=1 Tax=Mycena alexandri TaxID=1745969 RepID=A0AAD6S857_9AGAR|nr:hypothetical protein C8F04DRAFT_1195245 [Mycena alexandri]